MWRCLALCALLLSSASGGVVSQVRSLIARGDFAAAEKLVRDSRARSGATGETLEALSWLARGAFDAGRLDQADEYASETRKLALPRTKTGKLAADKPLELALGASIEVQAKVLAKRGDRSGAVAFLNRELKTWWSTPLRTRIQKNLNVLTLEGKPAPPLDVSQWLGAKPQPLETLKGKPVLLFFWAHWCPDCKGEAPALARIVKEYGPKGLVVMGPTQRYGYAAGGEETTPGEETRYIDRVRSEFYSALGDVSVPLSEENFRTYGASTVPTLVLIDSAGIVRLYHPGEMTYEELEANVRKIVMAADKRH